MASHNRLELDSRFENVGSEEDRSIESEDLETSQISNLFASRGSRQEDPHRSQLDPRLDSEFLDPNLVGSIPIVW